MWLDNNNILHIYIVRNIFLAVIYVPYYSGSLLLAKQVYRDISVHFVLYIAALDLLNVSSVEHIQVMDILAVLQ